MVRLLGEHATPDLYMAIDGLAAYQANRCHTA
jgi:hypothetical protein